MNVWFHTQDRKMFRTKSCERYTHTHTNTYVISRFILSTIFLEVHLWVQIMLQEYIWKCIVKCLLFWSVNPRLPLFYSAAWAFSQSLSALLDVWVPFLLCAFELWAHCPALSWSTARGQRWGWRIDLNLAHLPAESLLEKGWKWKLIQLPTTTPW